MKVRHILATLYFNCIGICLTAQIVNPTPKALYISPKYFNADSISAHHVREVHLSISNKADGEIIVNNGKKQVYVFDEGGCMQSYHYTILTNPNYKKKGVAPKHDTIHTSVFCDSINTIIGKRVKNGDFYSGHYYEYDNQNRVVKKTRFKETNANENGDSTVFVLGVQKLLSYEKLDYKQLTPTQFKIISYNEDDYPFKSSIVNYDSSGNLLSKYVEYTVSWMREEYKYTYDNLNRVVTSEIIRYSGKVKKTRKEYEYNLKGNISVQRNYKQGKLVMEINYLYDNETGLIKSEVNRDHAHNSIDIVKYKYVLF